MLLGSMRSPRTSLSPMRRPLGTIRENTSYEKSNKTILSDPRSTVESCIDLLSKADVDRNRVALQRLIRLTKTRLNYISGLHSVDHPSHAIVHGGGTNEAQLRNLLVTFLSDDEDEETTCTDNFETRQDDLEDDGFLSDDESIYSDEEDERPRGKHWGVLHSLALKVVVNALEQMISSEDPADSLPIDFSDSVWKRIMGSILHNIEECHNTEITGQSLKCLRLLHTFEPVVVAPLLQYTLLPHLVHLVAYGEQHRLPIVESEASRLLKRAEIGQRSLKEESRSVVVERIEL